MSVMTATAWARTLERIESEARSLTPRQVFLTLAAVPFFVLGWVAARVLAVLWLAGSWSWCALMVGWRDAGGLNARRRESG